MSIKWFIRATWHSAVNGARHRYVHFYSPIPCIFTFVMIVQDRTVKEVSPASKSCLFRPPKRPVTIRTRHCNGTALPWFPVWCQPQALPDWTKSHCFRRISWQHLPKQTHYCGGNKFWLNPLCFENNTNNLSFQVWSKNSKYLSIDWNTKRTMTRTMWMPQQYHLLLLR